MEKDVKSTGRKKKIYTLLIVIVGALSVITGIIGYGIYWAFYDVDRLPTGIFRTEETSPNGKYTVKLFYVEGGSTYANSVRGELIVNETKKSKNIYWDYRQYHTHIKWINNHTVEINGHQIDVPNGKFDWRHQ